MAGDYRVCGKTAGGLDRGEMAVVHADAARSRVHPFQPLVDAARRPLFSDIFVLARSRNISIPNRTVFLIRWFFNSIIMAVLCAAIARFVA